MPQKKEETVKEPCEDCPSSHTIEFTSENIKKIHRIQGEYLVAGKGRRSVEFIVNQLVKDCDR